MNKTIKDIPPGKQQVQRLETSNSRRVPRTHHSREGNRGRTGVKTRSQKALFAMLNLKGF